MADAVDICNMALSLLGEEAEVTSINPADGGDHANHCARWYPIALRRCLEDHEWSFATRRAELTQLTSGTVDPDVYGWKYGYSTPADLVRPIRLRPMLEDALPPPVRGGGRDRYEDLPFEMVTLAKNKWRTILCNVDGVTLTYTAYVDTAPLFPAYFIEPLAVLLAALLVGPVKRQDTTAQSASTLFKQYAQALSAAKSIDSQTAGQRTGHEILPSAIRARLI